jgi:hypothetical protein
MQQDGAGKPSQPPDGISKSPGVWERIKIWDGKFSATKGLAIVTVLTGFLGGYFQYLNAYEEKVDTQAKNDMAAATTTFLEISNAFAEVQLLQQIIYFDFVDALSEHTDAGDKAMSTKNARDVFPSYVKARTALRQNSSVLARKAEIYIDWASDLHRDPAAPRSLDDDPLSAALLGNYNFNCDASANFPHFQTVNTKKANHDLEKSAERTCAAGKEQSEDSMKTFVSLCARTKEGKIIPDKPPVTINWFSAKHHVLTMYYCFNATHAEMETARIWASSNDLSEERKTKFSGKKKEIKDDLDSQVIRLNAFMSLAMSQLERIRVKYRPAGFFCHVPLVRDAIGIFSTRCTPIRTAADEPT